MTNHDMHEHELDLIMALAAGSLSDAERAAAEATVARCDGCAAELAAQQLALQALQDAPAPALTELEAARMRRDLREQLGLATPTPVAAVPERSRFRWQRLSVALSAAAVLVLFVAIVPALDLFGGADDSAATVAFATSTTAAAESVAEAPPLSEDAAGDMTANVTGGEEAPITTIRTAPGGEDRTIDFGADPDLELLQRAAQQGLTETGNAANLIGFSSDLDSRELDPNIEACVDAGLASFDDSTPVVLGAGTLLDDEVFLIAYVDNAATTVALVAHDASTCEFIATAG